MTKSEENKKKQPTTASPSLQMLWEGWTVSADAETNAVPTDSLSNHKPSAINLWMAPKKIWRVNIHIHLATGFPARVQDKDAKGEKRKNSPHKKTVRAFFV